MSRLTQLEAWIEWGMSQEGSERQEALQDAWLEVQEHRLRDHLNPLEGITPLTAPPLPSQRAPRGPWTQSRVHRLEHRQHRWREFLGCSPGGLVVNLIA